MPILPTEEELTKAEEGLVITRTEPLFEYFVITSKQLEQFTEAAQQVARVYSQMAESMFGVTRDILRAQESIANFLGGFSKILSNFNQINFVIPILRLENYSLFPRQPLPIYIQPDKPYVSTKKLLEKGKQNLSLMAIKIEGKGFTIDGEYLNGITLNSKTGKLLQLMVREDLHGEVTDQLIGQAVGIPSSDYRAWGFVLRDLKKILIEKKKLKINMERYSGLERYRIKGLTRYLRKPRKTKKSQ